MVDIVEAEAERILAYKETLEDLVMNSGPQISLLTGLAIEELGSESAPLGIARVIQDRIRQVRNENWKPTTRNKVLSEEEEKRKKKEIELLLLYLIDSIVKKTLTADPPNKRYMELFTQSIVSNFCDLFHGADEQIRRKMQKLRGTWFGFFPPDKLSAIDRRIRPLDPKWPYSPLEQPVSAVPPEPVAKRPVVSANVATAAAERQRHEALKKVEQDRERLRKQKELDLELENRRLKLQLARTKEQQARVADNDFIQDVTPPVQQQTQVQANTQPARGKRKAHQPQPQQQQQNNNQTAKRQKGRGGRPAHQPGNLMNGRAVPLTGSNAADLLIRSPPHMVPQPTHVPSTAPLYSRRPVAAPVMEPMPFSTNGVVVYDDHHFNQSSFLPPAVPVAPKPPVSDYSLFSSQAMDQMRGQSFVPTGGSMQPLMQQQQQQQLMFQPPVPSVPVTVSSLLSNLTNAGVMTGGQSVVPAASAQSENPLQNVLELLGMTSGQTINSRAGQSEPHQVPTAGPASAAPAAGHRSGPWSSRTSDPRSAPVGAAAVPAGGSGLRSSPPDSNFNRMFGNEEPVEATVESLRIPRRSAIAKLYNGEQCSSCPQRFFTQDKSYYNKFPEEHEKDRKVYANHIQWHFRQNNKKRTKSLGASGQSRAWYYKLSDWLIFKEVNDELDIGEEETSFGEEQKEDHVDPEERTVPARSDKSQNVCKVCMEEFDSKYLEEDEEWVLLNAVTHDQDIYHPACLEDFMKNGGNLTPALAPDTSSTSPNLDTTAESIEPHSDMVSADQEAESKEDDPMHESGEQEEKERLANGNIGDVIENIKQDVESKKEGETPASEAPVPAKQEGDEANDKQDDGFEKLDTDAVNYDDEFADIGSELKAVQEAAAAASASLSSPIPDSNSQSPPAQQGDEVKSGAIADDEEGNLDSEQEVEVQRDRGNVVVRGKEESAACSIM